jgi:XTP/dITP diphosphohydrolase
VAESRPQVFLASRNAKKVAEMQRILEGFVPHVEVLGLEDVEHYAEPAETEPTFEGNALIKAHAGLEATGLPSLADDSGLCVDALNGMPGVLSARWSGLAKAGATDVDRANNELLLAQLSDVSDERRGGRFRCAVAFVHREGSGAVLDHVEHGEMPGRIIREMRGSGGFGYDVLFVPEGHDVTSAELPPEQKDAISHRGKALRLIAPVVAATLTGKG